PASAAGDCGWCSGARSVSARSRATTPSSIRTGSTKSVPPCTTRCPTASTSPKPATAAATVSRSTCPRPAGRSADATTRSTCCPRPAGRSATTSRSASPRLAGESVDATTRSAGSSTRSFRLLDPALTTSTRIESARSSVRPGPAADRRVVLAVLPGVGAGPHPQVAHQLPDVAGPGGQPRHPVDHVPDQVEAVHVVQHHHVERRGGGALLLVAADV